MNFRLWSSAVCRALSSTLGRIGAAALLAPLSAPLVAQNAPTVAIQPTPSCARCAIRLDKEVTLGDLDGPGSFVDYGLPAKRDSRGRYLVLDGREPLPLLFDSAGKFIAAIGRQGQGPGEIRRAFYAFFGRGDSILIPEQNFLTVYSPSLTFVRKVQTNALGSQYSVLPDGNLFLLGSVRTPAGDSIRFHILSTSGTHFRSFVRVPPRPVRAPGAPVRNALTSYALSNTSGQFWTFTNLDYRFTLNDSLGEPKRVWEGSAAWFAENEKKGELPIIGAVREDSRRVLWVLGRTRVPGWRERMPKPDADGNIFPTGNPFADTEGVLDAIDLDTGAIIASLRIPSMVQGFVDDQRIAILTETAAGIPRTEIWRFSLSGFSR